MLSDAEKKVAASLGLSPEALVLLQKRIAAENQLSKRELEVCEAIHMSPERYLANKIRGASPETSPEELRAEQARILRHSANYAPPADRSRMLAHADEIEATGPPEE